MCDQKHKKIGVLVNKLGSIKQNVVLSNVTKARETVRRLYTDLKTGTTVTQGIDTFIGGTEEATFPSVLFTDYADDAALLSHIKAVVCPPDMIDMCGIEIPASRRLDTRSLQESGSITVEITYEIDSDLFDSLVVNGTSFSDGSEFEEALADLLGVNTTDISISAASGTLVIEYIVTQEATGEDPLSEENLQALQDVQDELASITTTVVTELGLDTGDVGSESIDYCTDRDCNEHGVCDDQTGVCECTDVNFWGINCETPVACNNGIASTSDGLAYCICDYPEYGQRCQGTKNCSCG